ncbi:hypothetical protein [Priestia aryabhattai]|nr:hypothetical protein [Priestia aryabhattai]MED4261196.1 hypothetical protein [Priestia aryabhattai]
MSFRALGDHGIVALSQKLGRAGGMWVNTLEGGLSPYHLKRKVIPRV